MKSGSFSSYRAALSGTGADIGGERDDEPGPAPEIPAGLVSNPDAMAWAEAFVRHVRWKPSIATDEGAMVAWFASAMCAAHDELRRQLDRSEHMQP